MYIFKYLTRISLHGKKKLIFLFFNSMLGNIVKMNQSPLTGSASILVGRLLFPKPLLI